MHYEILRLRTFPVTVESKSDDRSMMAMGDRRQIESHKTASSCLVKEHRCVQLANRGCGRLFGLYRLLSVVTSLLIRSVSPDLFDIPEGSLHTGFNG